MPLRRTPETGGICPTERTGGVDWFRYRVDELRSVRAAREAAEGIQAEDVQRASKRKPWKFNGYEGWATESLRYGLRGGKLLWETSGLTAHSTWTRMPLSGGTAMRVDLQTTLRLSQSRMGFGKLCLPLAATTPPYLLPRGLPVWVKSGAGGWWHGQVAHRTNPSHMRLYDKGGESRTAEPGKLWRLELEAKYGHAEALCREKGEEMRSPEWCANYAVSQWLSAGCYWPVPADAVAGLRVRAPDMPPSTAGALAIWLTRTVKPVIPRLLTVFTVAEVLSMLGLDDVALPRRGRHDDDGSLPS